MSLKDLGCVKTCAREEGAELFVASAVGFQIDEIEKKFLHANSILEFSDSQDPSATLTAHRREHRQAAGADKEKDGRREANTPSTRLTHFHNISHWLWSDEPWGGSGGYHVAYGATGHCGCVFAELEFVFCVSSSSARSHS